MDVVIVSVLQAFVVKFRLGLSINCPLTLHAQVGGSIAALCTGVALKTLPQIRSITVLERYQQSQLKDQGAGIRVGDEVANFLQKYTNALTGDYTTPMTYFNIVNTAGDLLSSIDFKGNHSTTWIQLFRTLMRGFVDEKAGHSAICKYRSGCNVQTLVRYDEKVEVRMMGEDDTEETLLADLVVGADGASSKVREVLLPEVKRTYAGYVLLRGLVPVEELSDSAKRVMSAAAIFCYNHNSQMLSYTVPGYQLDEPSKGILLNWGWYQRKTPDELVDLMTDVAGKKHSFSLLPGSMQEHIAAEIRAKAQKELSPQFAEAVAKTKAPFVQVITDAYAPQRVFWDGKILLIGDASGGQRPHTASAVGQACLHADMLRQHLQGCMSLDIWSRETQAVSKLLVTSGQELGPIVLSETLDPGEKARLFAVKFTECQQRFAEKWKGFTEKNHRTHI